jgi:hypothetical protein
MGRKVPLRCSVRLHSRLLRPFSDSFSTHSGEQRRRDSHSLTGLVKSTMLYIPRGGMYES